MKRSHLLYIFTLLLFIALYVPANFCMKRIEPEKESLVPLSGKIVLMRCVYPTILDPRENLFNQLPDGVLNKIVARRTCRNALRKTCKRFGLLANTNTLLTLIALDDFRGSLEDIIKAVEQCIDQDKHELLQSILQNSSSQWGYSKSHILQPNITGVSPQEHAIYLDRDKCLKIIEESINCSKTIESISWRCDFLTESEPDDIAHTTNELTIKSFTDLICQKIYAHRVLKNEETINRLLLKNTISDSRNIETPEYAYTEMHIAVYNDDPTVLRLLFEYDYNPNATNTANGYTPLHIACKRGFPECVSTLLNQFDCDPNVMHTESQLCHNKLPLYYAAQYGATECARLILSSEKLKNRQTACQVALMYAIHSGCAELVEVLLADGTSPNIKEPGILSILDDDKSTTIPITDGQPIEVAARYNELAIIEQLLKAQATVTSWALDLAHICKHNAVFQKLTVHASAEARANTKYSHELTCS